VKVDWINLAQDRFQWRALCERGDKPSGSIKGGVFFDQLRECQLLKEDSAPWSKLEVVIVY